MESVIEFRRASSMISEHLLGGAFPSIRSDGNNVRIFRRSEAAYRLLARLRSVHRGMETADLKAARALIDDLLRASKPD